MRTRGRCAPVNGSAWLLVLAVLLTCGHARVAAQEPSKQAQKALGEKAIAIVQKATKVEAFRISSERTDKKGDQYIAGFPILEKAKDLDKDFAAKFAKVLLGDKAYGGVSARCYQPGVAFRIWQDKNAVEVIICFKCTNFEVHVMGADMNIELDLHGFGPGLEPFLALAKEAFPKDNEIQGLKSK
jgi:hypothetical protein